MESALYDPEKGFYSNRTQTADFYTAPELHPAFGAVLADRVAVLLRRVSAARPGEALAVVEAGCGNGTLAAQVARRLREKHPGVAAGLRFVLIERARRDLTEAARRLTAFGLPVDACTDVARLPSFTGVLYTNELFDALPAHLLQKAAGAMSEVYVDAGGRQTLGELSCPELAAPAAAIAPVLADGERHAVSLEAPRWLAAAAARLNAGFLLTLDYGKRFTAQTPNAPRAYRAHRIETDLTARPGLQDLTVPADFSALIAAGEAAGARLESYESLSRFLLEGGVEAFLAVAGGGDVSSYRALAQLKTLIHPEGMGEAFKVLVQRKNAS
ncbi:MAG TPA: SAM-dependent methyltransferase [Elusimicrobiota bacterium]|jgi:SAM-dependent MidA family methyltransferase|nr:SAM-dependent methyltransferase [Elusimicrobiota bacterium]